MEEIASQNQGSSRVVKIRVLQKRAGVKPLKGMNLKTILISLVLLL
jgi:hypothetical protein